MVRFFFLQNYTSGAVGDGVRDLTLCPTAVGGARYLAPPAAVSHNGRGPISFQIFLFFCLNSDGVKFYMKIILSDGIYYFVVQSFSI
jgi:hypothetical protein